MKMKTFFISIIRALYKTLTLTGCSIICSLLVAFMLAGCAADVPAEKQTEDVQTATLRETETMPEGVEEYEAQTTAASITRSEYLYENFDWASIPEYSGNDFYIVNNDEPLFSSDEMEFSGTHIALSYKDNLGRCRVAQGCLGQETEPTEKRGDISNVYPSGWNQMQLSDETWLYNRSHLLMFALTGLNDDDRNLITGSEYFNQQSMLGLEETVKWVIDNKNAHVAYRVTPVYNGDDLVAKGVLMEAYCIEYPADCTFCRFVYNVEPGVMIDYSTGKAKETPGYTQGIPDSRAERDNQKNFSSQNSEKHTLFEDENDVNTDIYNVSQMYVLNTNSKKFHLPTCDSVNKMSEKNKQEFTGTRDELIAEGYTPCGSCNP